MVTDYFANTITLLEAANGRLIQTIDVKGERRPRDITVDNQGNAYISYFETGEIYIWSNDFKTSRLLLSEKELGDDPRCIVYNSVNDILYVSYENNNMIDCFQLQ